MYILRGGGIIIEECALFGDEILMLNKLYEIYNCTHFLVEICRFGVTQFL